MSPFRSHVGRSEFTLTGPPQWAVSCKLQLEIFDLTAASPYWTAAKSCREPFLFLPTITASHQKLLHEQSTSFQTKQVATKSLVGQCTIQNVKIVFNGSSSQSIWNSVHHSFGQLTRSSTFFSLFIIPLNYFTGCWIQALEIFDGWRLKISYFDGWRLIFWSFDGWRLTPLRPSSVPQMFFPHFWRLLWSITEQTHGNMESVCL